MPERERIYAVELTESERYTLFTAVDFYRRENDPDDHTHVGIMRYAQQQDATMLRARGKLEQAREVGTGA